MTFNKYLISFFILFFIWTDGSGETFSMALKQVDLRDALRMVGKFLHRNIVISPTVQGVTSLQLHSMHPQQAFDSLLTAHGLATWQIDQIWFVAPQEELIKSKENQLKWQQLLADALPLKNYFRQIKFANAEEIARVLQDEHASLLSKKGMLRINKRTNHLYVRDTTQHIRDIRQVIDRLDIPTQQILIETRLVSIDNDFERELGLNFSLGRERIENQEDSLQVKASQAFSVLTTNITDYSRLDIKLSALEKAGHAEVISSPSLFTMNQLQASIEAGEEVPYQEMTEKGATAINFKKAVLGLKVTPQVLPGNRVLLQLQINQDRPNNRMVLGMPMISTRQIITSVLVRHGQTLVLGGIYEISDEKGQQEIPFVNRLPIIGILFKQHTVKKMKRQLLIFVTPKIIE